MSLAEAELNIGGTSFKGVYIAILFSLATSLGGGVWMASSLYSRLEAVEAVSVPDIVPLEEKIILIEQELTANSVSQLQGKLAELGTNLLVIKEQQASLLLIKAQVTDLEKQIEGMKATVTKSEVIADSLSSFSDKYQVLTREINDIWDGLDELSANPLR